MYDPAVSSTPRSIASDAASHAGLLLRDWRNLRRLSQLDLSLEVGVSARHLSCIETGKAQPSREMISKLANALAMPLREHNALLMAAGYAPRYAETSLATQELAPARRAIEFILKQQEPYPAFVMDRYWNVLMTNSALPRIFGKVRGRAPLHGNILHQIFDPNDMRPVVANWDDVASDVIRHLHHQIAAAPSDTKARSLLDEVLKYPDVPAEWRTREPGMSPSPLLTTTFRNEDLELRFLSTFTTFGTTWNVTIEELRIESMFPADEETAEICRSIAAA